MVPNVWYGIIREIPLVLLWIWQRSLNWLASLLPDGIHHLLPSLYVTFHRDTLPW